MCEDWVEQLDFDSLECLSSEHVSSDLRCRHDDLIWRVKFSGEWLYVYILLEFQSSVDTHMAVRLLTYLGLLYEDIVTKKWFTKSGLLPPVLPIVLYNGDNRWTAKTDINDLIEKIPGNLANYSPRLKYMLIDEGAYGHSELESMKSVVSVLFQLENTPVKEISAKLFLSALEWLKDNKGLQRAFYVFVDRIYYKGRLGAVRLLENVDDDEEVTAMLQKHAERFLEEWRSEALAEGEAKGEAKGRREVAKKMLMTGMAISQISEMTGLPEEELNEIRDSFSH